MGASRLIVAPRAALTGLAFALPFLVLNAIVGGRVEPFFSLLRPGVHTGPLEYPLLAVVLLLPAGAVVALRPALQAGADGHRSYPLANMLIAALLVAAFLLIGFVLGQEIYRCDVLGIPNCD
jgi:hypothetical protein